MYKKIITAAFLLTTVLSVTACGRGTETAADVSTEPSSVESPSDKTEARVSTENSAGEASRPNEETEEEASVSYIFSDMPAAAYEVTGLGVGRFESVNNETIITEEGYDYGIIPFVRLTPGENTFILFCMLGDQDENMSIAAIHSPSGSGQWEAVTYSCLDGPVNPMPDGFSPLIRKETSYDEGTYGGNFDSWNEWYPEWIQFTEIYHPDAPQEDTIYVVNVIQFSYFDDFDEIDEVLAGVIDTFDYLGATVNEIPVEEALKRSNILVSEGDVN